MTPTQNEIIQQKQKRITWLQDRIAFHSDTRQRLIDEAAHEQSEIDAIRNMRDEELGLCLRVNMADEGQD